MERLSKAPALVHKRLSMGCEALCCIGLFLALTAVLAILSAVHFFSSILL